jgi:hypothetical protein
LSCKETIKTSIDCINDLRAIECANLFDQDLLIFKDFPILFNFWKINKEKEILQEDDEYLNDYEEIKNKLKFENEKEEKEEIIKSKLKENEKEEKEEINKINEKIFKKEIEKNEKNEKEKERKVYKIFEKEEFEENEIEIKEMCEELRKIGFIYIELKEEVEKYNQNLLNFSKEYFNLENTRYKKYNNPKFDEFNEEIPSLENINPKNTYKDHPYNKYHDRNNPYIPKTSSGFREYIDFNEYTNFNSDFDIYR